MAISGVSVVFYCAHRARPAAVAEAIDRRVLQEFTDDRSYAEKLRPGAGLFYSTLLPGGPLPSALRRQLRCRHAPPMRQSLLWFGDEYLLSALPIVLSAPKAGAHAIHLSGALTVDDFLSFLALLSSPDQAALLARQAAESLVTAGVVGPDGIEDTWPLPGRLGIQVWNLDGTAGRNTSDLYQGVAESVKYSWEISALLSYNSDHLLESGLWRRRSPQQVFGQVRTGFGFFDDHMVFLNADCCLEMSHLPAWLRDRSEFRLSNYGYDSSSLFVWTAGMLQTAIVEDLGKRYRGKTGDFLRQQGMTAAEHARFTQEQLRHSSLLDRLTGFRDYLVEARNRAFDESRGRESSSDRATMLLRREMEKSATLADGLLKVREEAAQFRRDSVLAIIGIALAATQIPGFISQTDIWIRSGNWSPLIISSVLIVAVLSVMPLVWRRQKR